VILQLGDWVGGNNPLQKISPLRNATQVLGLRLFGTVTVMLSLCVTKHHTMKTYWGVELYLHTSLTLALDGGEWSASCPGHFTLKEKAPGTYWIGGWEGPKAGLDIVVREVPSHCWELNPRTPVFQHVA
jgi:hypothetical protein